MIVNLKQSIMDDENHMREVEKYLNPKVLFIDDFLKVKTTPADINYIYKIINSRYLQQKPFIISTEKTLKEILDFDEAVGSRIMEMAKENIVIFGEDTCNYRLKKFGTPGFPVG